MHILLKHYYLRKTLIYYEAVEIFLRKKVDFGGKMVKKGHAQTLLSSDCTTLEGLNLKSTASECSS
jgi:hypothetical protein